jgi:hypothetical protein
MQTWHPTPMSATVPPPPPPVAFPRAEPLDLKRFVCPTCRYPCRCTGYRATETEQTYIYVCRRDCASTYLVTVRAEPLGEPT